MTWVQLQAYVMDQGGWAGYSPSTPPPVDPGPDPTPPPEPVPAIPSALGMIGDAHTAQGGSGAQRNSLIAGGFPAAETRVDGLVGRGILLAGITHPNTGEVIATWRGEGFDPPIWVLALGSDNIAATDQVWIDSIGAVLDTIAAGPRDHYDVYWVGLAVRDSAADTRVTRFQAVLNGLVGTREKIDFKPLDWNAHIHNGRVETGLWDLNDAAGRNMTQAGYDIRNAFVTTAITGQETNSTTKWGASIGTVGGETKRAAMLRIEAAGFGTPHGGKLGAVRVFDPIGAGPTWPTSLEPFTPRSLVYSFRFDVASVIAGGADTQIRAFFTAATSYLNATGNAAATVDWGFNHEPELEIQGGDYTAAQYRSAWARLINIQKTEFPHARLGSVLILMQWTLVPASGRVFADYYPPTVDTIAFDTYKMDPSTTIPSMVDRIVAKSVELGKPWGIAETGVDELTHNASQRSTALTALSNYIGTRNPQPKFVTYFETDRNVGTDVHLWTIADDPTMMSAWLSGIPTTTPAPPTPPPASSGTFTFSSTAVAGGGFQNTIKVSPFATTAGVRPYLIGADVAGVHRSTNRGATWTPAAQGSLATGAHVAAIMWSDETPGKAFVAEDSGIHMTLDYGATWARRSAAALTDWDANNDVKPAGEEEHPRQTGLLLAQDNSTATKHVWCATETQGLRRSTDDFTTFASTVMVGMPISSIALDPNDRDVLYASVRSTVAANNGVWKITNARGAMVATRMLEYPGSIAWPAGPVEMRAVDNVGATDLVVAGHTAGMFLYKPSTNVWMTINTGLPIGTAVYRSVGVDPTRPTVWYCGVWHPVNRQAVFMSSNRGANWTSITGPGPVTAPAAGPIVIDWKMFGTQTESWLRDIAYHSFAGPSTDWIAASIEIDPDVTNRVLVAGRGGAWFGTLSGNVRTWQPSVNGLMVTVNMAVDTDDLTPGRIGIANMDYVHIFSDDAGLTAKWSEPTPRRGSVGDALCYDMAATTGPSRVYVTNSPQGQATGTGGIFSSINPELGTGAATWTDEVGTAFTSDVPAVAVGKEAGGQRVILAAVSNTAGSTVGGLWRKLGATWTQYRNPATHPFGLSATTAAANAGSLRFRRNSAVAYALDDNGVWRTDNAGFTWVLLLTGVTGVYGTYNALELDPTDLTKVYVSSGGTVRRINNANTSTGTTVTTTTVIWAGNAGNIALRSDGVEMFLNVRGDGRLMRSTDFRTAATQAAANWVNVATPIFQRNTPNIRSLAVTPTGIILTAENGSGAWRGVRS